jgi:hypothetical protein
LDLALPGGARGKPTLDRELQKVLTGFTCDTGGRSIVTGNWGCGAFGGSHKVNTLIQLMAAAVGMSQGLLFMPRLLSQCWFFFLAGKDLIYTTFKDRNMEGVDLFHNGLVTKHINIADVYTLLSQRILWCRSATFDEILAALERIHGSSSSLSVSLPTPLAEESRSGQSQAFQTEQEKTREIQSTKLVEEEKEESDQSGIPQ